MASRRLSSRAWSLARVVGTVGISGTVGSRRASTMGELGKKSRYTSSWPVRRLCVWSCARRPCLISSSTATSPLCTTWPPLGSSPGSMLTYTPICCFVARRRMRVTVPILTPRISTGAPTSSPPTDPSKNMTKGSSFLKICRPPRVTSPATARAIAPTTKAPMAVGLARALTPWLPPCVRSEPLPLPVRPASGRREPSGPSIPRGAFSDRPGRAWFASERRDRRNCRRW